MYSYSNLAPENTSDMGALNNVLVQQRSATGQYVRHEANITNQPMRNLGVVSREYMYMMYYHQCHAQNQTVAEAVM